MERNGDPTRRAFRRALAAEGAVIGCVWGGALAAAAILAVRALVHPAPGWTAALLSLIPSAALLRSILNLRRTPSRGACAALTENATHAGGLLLVDGIPGSEAWPRPEPVAAEVPLRLRRHLVKLPVVVAALAFALAAPAGWFASAVPPAPQAFPDITADLRNALDDIKAEELLEPETVEELAEELKRIEASADPAEPGAALDAADRLRERVAALLELNDATLKRIAKDSSALSGIASDPDAADDFQKMLDESCSGSCPGGEEQPGAKCECEGEEGAGAGAGAPERGRGDAKMSWTDPSELGDSRYNDKSTELNPGEKPDEVKVGESISTEDPTANAPGSQRGASAAIGGRSAVTSINRTVSPRHRATVKRFFETERKSR